MVYAFWERLLKDRPPLINTHVTLMPAASSPTLQVRVWPCGPLPEIRRSFIYSLYKYEHEYSVLFWCLVHVAPWFRMLCL